MVLENLSNIINGQTFFFLHCLCFFVQSVTHKLTSQSSLICLAKVVWISVREQLRRPLEVSIRSCRLYMSSFSTKCWRSWSCDITIEFFISYFKFHHLNPNAIWMIIYLGFNISNNSYARYQKKHRRETVFILGNKLG